jgi:putative membrane protein
MFGFHWGNWYFGFIFLPIIIWAIGSSFPKNSRTNSNSAIDILRERYARGEISKQEFEEKKRDLTKSE